MCQDRLTLKTKHPEITHTEDIHLIVLICNKHLKMKKQTKIFKKPENLA